MPRFADSPRTLVFSGLFAICLALATTASAERIYYLPGEEPQGVERVNLQRLGEAGTLLIAPDDRQALELEGAETLIAPKGTTVHLVAQNHAHPPAEILGLHGTVLKDLGDYIVIAVDDRQDRVLDQIGVCRQRLIYIPPSPFARSGLIPDAPLYSKTSSQSKAEIVDAVSEAKLGQNIRELSGGLVYWIDGALVSNDNRYTHSLDHHKAADYLEDRLQALGYPVTRQEFSVSGTPTQNIIAVKTGTVMPDEIIVVGAHYDATSQNPTVLAPGAEDNASGTAAVLHMAQILAPYEVEKTVHFVAFGGEEQGLYGSQHYVTEAINAGQNVSNALTMDMIAAWVDDFKVVIEGQHAWESLMSLMEDNVQEFGGIGYYKEYNSWGSDHVPFQQAGIPAFLAIDWDYPQYAHYHRTTDVFEHTDPVLARAIVRSVLGTLVDLVSPTLSGTATPPTPSLATRLDQNHPNPFNPTTTISFELAVPSHAKLDIYDTAGRHIATVLDEELGEGPHTRFWNGRDTRGGAVSSGIYLYRLEAQDTVLTRRMVLAK